MGGIADDLRADVPVFKPVNRILPVKGMGVGLVKGVGQLGMQHGVVFRQDLIGPSEREIFGYLRGKVQDGSRDIARKVRERAVLVFVEIEEKHQRYDLQNQEKDIIVVFPEEIKQVPHGDPI
jgi:hypothetical protein